MSAYGDREVHNDEQRKLLLDTGLVYLGTGKWKLKVE